jgi:hypothetical protein
MKVNVFVNVLTHPFSPSTPTIDFDEIYDDVEDLLRKYNLLFHSNNNIPLSLDTFFSLKVAMLPFGSFLPTDQNS